MHPLAWRVTAGRKGSRAGQMAALSERPAFSMSYCMRPGHDSSIGPELVDCANKFIRKLAADTTTSVGQKHDHLAALIRQVFVGDATSLAIISADKRFGITLLKCVLGLFLLAHAGGCSALYSSLPL